MHFLGEVGSFFEWRVKPSYHFSGRINGEVGQPLGDHRWLGLFFPEILTRRPGWGHPWGGAKPPKPFFWWGFLGCSIAGCLR